MKLIVGLGNPGKEYENTRHNVGFIILDNLIGSDKFTKKDNYLIYKDNDVIYLKPLTYMNLSGDAVIKIVNYYKIDINDILVVHDDLDLPANTYKLKKNSSSGGHNGIKSIISVLHSEGFARLKVGIANNKGIDTKDYVLAKIPKEELNYLNSDIFKDIINSFINDGIEKTMNIYNTKA